MNNNTQALPIDEILKGEEDYIVPIYQRNYEWEKPQISKLINDIYDSADNYYLGTLVTFKRADNTYELIDGQQRHTTLNLIKAVLSEGNEKCNLSFQARPECDSFLQKIMKDGAEQFSENERAVNLANGVKIIKDVFQQMKHAENSTFSEDDFRDKFFNKTFIFRTELPENTDLNHYFEIMNNRGEQLENHEILKAKMMSEVEEKNRHACAKVWEACSDMENYLWENFDKETSLKLFSEQNSGLINLEEFSSIFGQNADENSNLKLDMITENHQVPDKFSQENQSKTEKYRSVVDFPTFLLCVLYLIKAERENFSFDDKKLLDTFSFDENSKIFSKEITAEYFIEKLFQYRLLFDRIIIKNDNFSSSLESKWGVRTFVKSENEIKTAEIAFGDSDLEKKIEMLQAMFYYSNISNNKKEWLLKLLEKKFEDGLNVYNVLFEAFQKEIKNLNVEQITYHNSISSQFYYFEYMLWEVYFNYLKGSEDKLLPESLEFLKNRIDRNQFNTFYFRQLNSKEHLLAQEIAKDKDCDSETLNSFGNLCLISDSDNSSSNNHAPDMKMKRLSGNNSSLKRQVMFKTYDGDQWNTEQIRLHEQEMKKLLDFYQNFRN